MTQKLEVTFRGLRLGQTYYPCTLGRGGRRADKREGDGATPLGSHTIVGMLYRPDRVARPNDWAIPIGIGDLWSDASGDIDYNQMVRAPYLPSAESLRRADPLYDLVMITDWNYPLAEPDKGSAIFIHQWRRPGFPTEGCVALSRAHLHDLARRVEFGAQLIIR